MTRDELSALERCTAQVAHAHDRIDRILVRNEILKATVASDVTGAGVPKALQSALVYGGALRQRVDHTFARHPPLFTIDPDEKLEQEDTRKDDAERNDADTLGSSNSRLPRPTAVELLRLALELLWVGCIVLAVWLGWSRFAAIARHADEAATPSTASHTPTPRPTPGSP